MWPHKSGLGVQLSYGVDGNAILDPNAVFPKSSSGSFSELRRIRGPSISLVKSQQVSGIDIESSSIISSTNQYVPESLTHALEDEAAALTHDSIYNPSVGSLMAIHKIKTKNGYKYSLVMAYTTGDSGNILNIAPLTNKDLPIKSNHSSSAWVPVLGPPMQVEFAEPILQISFSKIEAPLDMVPAYLLVRTESRVYIMICEKSPVSSQVQSRKPNDVEIVIIDEIKPSNLNDMSFADVSFNPYDFTQFAVVDSEGSFAIWSMNPRKKVVHKLKQVVKDCQVAKDSSLSKWRRIEWLNEPNVVFLISRCSLIKYTIKEQEALHLITSNTWSRIRDYQRCYSGKYAFLLTSKELIWLQVDSGLKRLLSWKHFLDGNDPSLKLSMTEFEPEHFTCMIYSQRSSLVFVYNFSLSPQGPKMTQNPYYIRCQKEVHQLMLFHPSSEFFEVDANKVDYEEEATSNKIFCMLQLKVDHTICLDLFDVDTTENKQKSLPLSLVEVVDSATDDLNLEEIRNKAEESKPKLFKRLKKFEICKLANSIIKASDISDAENDVENIQAYAYKLGKNGRKLNGEKGFISLLELAEEVPSVVQNLDEYDNMVEQLSSFFEDKDIDVSNFLSTVSVSENDPKRIENIEDLFTYLNKQYRSNGLERFNQKSHLSEAAMILGSACIRLKSKKDVSNGDELAEKELEKSQSNLVKNVVSKWDMDPSTPWISTVADSVSQRSQKSRNGSKLSQRRNVDPIVVALSQTSQMPQIRLSQPSLIRSTQRELNFSTSQASSQIETQGIIRSQDPSQSQGMNHSQSQKRSQPLSQKKRKKKKKGGFA